MRYLKLAVAGIFLILLSCCRKPGDRTFLQLSQTELSPGEPLLTQLFNFPDDARLEWQFPHNARILKFYGNSKVNLTFTESDNSTKLICVKVYAGPDTATYSTYCKEIKVDTARFAPPASLPEDRVKSLDGDRLTLKPVIYSSDSSLNFIVETKNHYSCFNAYVYYDNASVRNSNVSISFNGVWLPYKCSPALMPVVSLCQTYSYYKDGIYPVQIAFNGKVYKGTLTVSDYQTKYEFNWPHTEGVLIEPKVIDRF